MTVFFHCEQPLASYNLPHPLETFVSGSLGVSGESELILLDMSMDKLWSWPVLEIDLPILKWVG